MPRTSNLMPERLDKIERFIGNYKKQRGFSPTIREIGNYIGIDSTSHIKHYLIALRRQERLFWTEHASRSFRLGNSNVDQAVRVRWLGYIAGGQPISIPNQAEFTAYPDQFVTALMSMLGPNDPENLFSLTVKGDSMVDANISDGDTVIFKPSHEARTGEMVAVWLADENTTTLKYFHCDSSGITLRPANPAYRPIKIERPEQVHIQGKVVAVIRKMDQM